MQSMGELRAMVAVNDQWLAGGSEHVGMSHSPQNNSGILTSVIPAFMHVDSSPNERRSAPWGWVAD
jgi:hypothetical protein